jgi:hypothetical protein
MTRLSFGQSQSETPWTSVSNIPGLGLVPLFWQASGITASFKGPLRKLGKICLFCCLTFSTQHRGSSWIAYGEGSKGKGAQCRARMSKPMPVPVLT